MAVLKRPASCLRSQWERFGFEDDVNIVGRDGVLTATAEGEKKKEKRKKYV